MKRFFALAALVISVVGSFAQSPPMIIDNLIVTNMTAGGDIWTPGVGQVFVGNWLWSTGGITVGSAPLQGSLEQDAVGWFTDKPWQFGPGAFCSMLSQDGSVVIIDSTKWLGAVSNETTRARFYGDGYGLTNLNAQNLTNTLPLSALPTNVAYLNSNQLFIGANTFANRVYVKTNTTTGLAQNAGLMLTADYNNTSVNALYILPPFDGSRCFIGLSGQSFYQWDWGNVSYWVNVPTLIQMKASTVGQPYEGRIASTPSGFGGNGDLALEANNGDGYICGPRNPALRRSMMFYSAAAISDGTKMNGCFMFIASNTPAMWTNWHSSWNKANSRTDYIMTLDMNGNLATAGTMSPTNGVINQVNRSTSNAVTMVASKSVYLVNGTNQLVTLPSASSTTGVVFRVSSTNGWGSFIITNATGAQSIRDGTSLSYTNIGIGEVGLFSDGAAWWLASKARTILPSASWSSATTITPAQDTITNIPWTDLEYNNSQGITLRTNATFVRPTQLWVTNSGTYMITFSAVLKGSVGGSVLSIWLRRDGSDVVRTRTDQGFTGASAQQCMTVNYFVSVGPPTYFELCAASHDASPPTIVGATANPTGYTAPAMPAIIVTINRVSDPWP